ncbi:hypothetical protein MLD38_015516 [Melastoma candidum]|uniref:Uncharacterized protein n=1 Tax=Melastoma candidum TaxID=119954 RepID=A0ACB9RI96_9MYRT|nr:hypothetical protein MLD38_015516 [Melastoma candidum]
MGIFSKVTGFFGFRNPRDGDDDHDDNQGDHDRRHQLGGPGDGSDDRDENFRETGVPRRGFSVQVAVERPGLGPILAPCDSGDGGIQGLKWCTRRLRMDEDGDVAHEFLDEVVDSDPSLSPSTALEQVDKPPLPRFQVRHRTRPAMVKNQAMDFESGKLQFYVEHQGRLQWV